jgi:hypothetical protein
MQREFCIVAVGIVRPERPVRHRRFSLPFDAPDQRAAPFLRANAASQGGLRRLQIPEGEARC